LDIQFIDELAANGRTPLHDALPGAKIAASALLLAAAIAASSPRRGRVCGSGRASRGLRYQAATGVYGPHGPISSGFRCAFRHRICVVGSYVCPYCSGKGFHRRARGRNPNHYDILRRRLLHHCPDLSKRVADALFMGYRAFFILIDELQGLITAVRLRGGVSGTLREQLSTYGKMLGVLVIHSADMTDTNVPR